MQVVRTTTLGVKSHFLPSFSLFYSSPCLTLHPNFRGFATDNPLLSAFYPSSYFFSSSPAKIIPSLSSALSPLLCLFPPSRLPTQLDRCHRHKMHQSTQSKNTPGRRRQGRNNNNNTNRTPQKMYASENDVATYKTNGHFASPCTPQRARGSGGDNTTLQTSSANPKQRGSSNKNNRNRNKNGGTSSPGHQKQGRPSPPMSMSMPSRQEPTPAIFAGSTFHASPAPSALPMPSFFSRSHSDSPSLKPTPAPLALGQEPSPPSTDSEDALTPPLLSRKEESPLEFFFRADRAEKARTHRANSAITPAPFSPPRDSPPGQNTVPKAAEPTRQSRRPPIPQRSTASGISSSELDGNPGQPLGPAFSTPYQDRIRAARPNSNSEQATPTTAQNQDVDPSEALKRFFFHGESSPSSQGASPKPQQTHRQHQPREHFPSRQLFEPTRPRHNVPQKPNSTRQSKPEQQSLPRGMFPASVLKGQPTGVESEASAVLVSPSTTRSDIGAMEDNLRRMLKLSPSS